MLRCARCSRSSDHVAKSTSKLFVVDCPRCGVRLQLSVHGVPQTMGYREFMAQLNEDDLDDIHHRHVDEDETVLSVPRVRTRPITKIPAAGQRIKRITKPPQR